MTLREIYQALLDGKKLCCPKICFRYVHLKDGCLKHDDGSLACISFTMGEWSIYEEPEDLDQKIREVEEDVRLCLSNQIFTGTVQEISELIDLKIKKAKL